MNKDILQKFLTYSFEDDPKYQAGALHIGKDSLETRRFYYDKFVSPFPIQLFQDWQAGKHAQENLDETIRPPVIDLGDKFSCNKLSFQEIVEKVQKGQEIDGVKQIEEKIHSKGSESAVKPRAKPWEADKN
jgi:hypothetical protein